jgi:hypothetical protein
MGSTVVMLYPENIFSSEELSNLRNNRSKVNEAAL